ncbi:MAG TPA: hypothetical protein PK453_11885 [Leptospiraceae bacterium]|nr:hypothetical protein [Leptospiraceae bacterium]
MKRVYLTAVLLFMMSFCGPTSSTGTPGLLNRPYSADSYLAELEKDKSILPKDAERNREAIRRMIPSLQEKRIRQKKILQIQNEKIQAEISVVWKTAEIEGKHLILSAELNSLSYGEGTSCKSQDFRRAETNAPFFDFVSTDITCGIHFKNSSHTAGYFLSISGADEVNTPLLPDGKLHIGNKTGLTVKD